MKSKQKIFGNLIAVTTCILIASCKPSLDAPKVNAGDADFSSYVAVGGTYTSGYADGALTLDYQQSSIPKLLSQQFALAGGGDFRQPLVNAGNGFGSDSLFGNVVLHGKLHFYNYQSCNNLTRNGIEFLPVNNQDRNWIGNQGLFNNLSVPGAKAADLFSQYFGKNTNSGNPYYARFATDTGGVSGLSSTVLSDALLVDPTFFTLWVGSNDILLYAIAGGERTGNDQFNPAPANSITDDQRFNSAIDTIITKLSSGHADGVVANIPELTDLPFFRNIPYNGLTLTAQQAADLTAAFGSLGYTFTEGKNNFIIKDGTGIRRIENDELILFSIPQDSLLCGGWGTPAKPIPASFVLDRIELQKTEVAIQKFNAKIRAAALSHNLAFADMHAFFKTLSSGVVYNGATYSTGWLQGGVFSLDGLYLNQRGNALAANVFIRAINNTYKSNLPEIDANAYPGVRFP